LRDAFPLHGCLLLPSRWPVTVLRDGATEAAAPEPVSAFPPQRPASLFADAQVYAGECLSSMYRAGRITGHLGRRYRPPHGHFRRSLIRGSVPHRRSVGPSSGPHQRPVRRRRAYLAPSTRALLIESTAIAHLGASVCADGSPQHEQLVVHGGIRRADRHFRRRCASVADLHIARTRCLSMPTQSPAGLRALTVPRAVYCCQTEHGSNTKVAVV
jgi:hypothetical protein